MLQLIFLYTTVNYTLLYLDVVLFHTRMSVVPMAPNHSTGSKKRKEIFGRKSARKHKNLVLDQILCIFLICTLERFV